MLDLLARLRATQSRSAPRVSLPPSRNRRMRAGRILVHNCGMTHYHVWLRRGRIFSMRPTLYRTRSAGHKAAAKRESDPACRLVLACADCPKTSRSKRRQVRWPRVAEALGVSTGALRAAIDSERERPPRATRNDAGITP